MGGWISTILAVFLALAYVVANMTVMRLCPAWTGVMHVEYMWITHRISQSPAIVGEVAYFVMHYMIAYHASTKQACIDRPLSE